MAFGEARSYNGLANMPSMFLDDFDSFQRLGGPSFEWPWSPEFQRKPVNLQRHFHDPNFSVEEPQDLRGELQNAGFQTKPYNDGSIHIPIHFEPIDLKRGRSSATKSFQPDCDCYECRVRRQVGRFHLSPRVPRRGHDFNASFGFPGSTEHTRRSHHNCNTKSSSEKEKPPTSRSPSTSRSNHVDYNEKEAKLLHQTDRESPTNTQEQGVVATSKVTLSGAQVGKPNIFLSSKDCNCILSTTVPERHMHDENIVKIPVESIITSAENIPPENIQDPMECEDTKNYEHVPVIPEAVTRRKLAAIKTVLEEVQELEVQVNNFSVTANSKEYRYCEEMLTKCLLKLDDILTEGMEEVKAARKQVVHQINDCLRILESKMSRTEDPCDSSGPTMKTP